MKPPSSLCRCLSVVFFSLGSVWLVGCSQPPPPPVKAWETSTTSLEGVTVKMPPPVKKQPVPAPNGQTYETLMSEANNRMYMMSVEPYEAAPPDTPMFFDETAATQGRESVAAAIEARMPAMKATLKETGELQQHGDYWGFDYVRDQSVGSRSVEVTTRTIFYPEGAIVMQFGGLNPGPTETEEFFDTLTMRPLSDFITPEEWEDLFGGGETEAADPQDAAE